MQTISALEQKGGRERQSSSRAGVEGEEMSDRSRNIGARLLILCWVISIVGGFFASLVMSIQAFRDANSTSGMVLGAIAIGCAVLCYRTYVARDQLRT
jgi:hypothetical protein